MTSSPGLRGRSHLQALRGVLQTPTDDRRRQTRERAKQYVPPTLRVGGPVVSQLNGFSHHWDAASRTWLETWGAFSVLAGCLTDSWRTQRVRAGSYRTSLQPSDPADWQVLRRSFPQGRRSELTPRSPNCSRHQ